MKLTLSLLSFVFAAMAFADDPIDLYTEYNKGTPPDTESPYLRFDTSRKEWFATDNKTYVLSNDLEVSINGTLYGFRHPANSIFDFREHGKTLKMARFCTTGVKNSITKCFGGTYDLSGNFQFGGWGGSDYSGSKWYLEDVDIKMSGWTAMPGMGTDVEARMTNCTITITSGSYNDLAPANGSAKDSYSRLIEFADTKFYCKLDVNDNRNTGTDVMQNTTIRFTGPKAELIKESGNYGTVTMYVGKKAPGYRWEFLNGATGAVRQLCFGYEAQGRSNVLHIANHAGFSAEYDLVVGSAAGADFNTLEVLDESSLIVRTSTLYVGGSASNNRLVLSNSTASVKDIRIGKEAGSTNNTAVIAGASSRLNFLSTKWLAFLKGSGNSLRLTDHFAKEGLGTVSMDGDFANTNNTLIVDDGATLGADYLRLEEKESFGNTFILGDGATVNVKEMTFFAGSTNFLCVITNGTVNFSAAYGFYAAGDRNKVVLAGQSPKIRCTGTSGAERATFRNGVTLAFDFGALTEPYAEAPISVPTWQVNAGTRVVFENVERLSELRKEAKAKFDIPLVHSENGFGEVNKDVLPAAAAQLPEGCTLRTSDDGKDLFIRVKPESGIVIIVR